MINIIEEKDCCGCSACLQICPKQCIYFTEDKEGFSYPKVDTEQCINCSLCDQVCPVINQSIPRNPLDVYAAKNNNEEVRLESSSGGVFTLFAEQILNENGVVFGARFDNKLDVIHDYTETIEGLKAFRGSKYVESVIGETYIQARSFLRQGRKVLFSGTPCQIAGLNLFLRKEYPNLLTIDFICHGVPSPKVWKMYRDELLSKTLKESNTNVGSFSSIHFRDKSSGWQNYSFSSVVNINKHEKCITEIHNQNIYMKGFLKDLYLRPACHYCPTKSLKSGSHITVADFWGIQYVIPDFNDDKGTSLIILNKNININIPELDIKYRRVHYNEVKKYNIAVDETASPHQKRSIFFDNIQNSPLSETIVRLLKVSLSQKLSILYIKIGRKISKFICS